jgi:hypothetical protein
MKPYEEIDFPNGFLRWIRKDGMYGCTLTEEQMVKIKAIHEAPRTWVGLTDEDCDEVERWVEFKEEGSGRIPMQKLIRYIEAKLKEKNNG